MIQPRISARGGGRHGQKGQTMTTSIGRDLQHHPSPPPEPADQPAPRRGLLRGIQAATGVAVVICGAFTTMAVTHEDLKYTVAACAWFTVSAIGAALLAGHAMLADRQDFYRRGQVDGWHRGYRMELPDVDDPLFR
jgi:hypothetical protein